MGNTNQTCILDLPWTEYQEVIKAGYFGHARMAKQYLRQADPAPAELPPTFTELLHQGGIVSYKDLEAKPATEIPVTYLCWSCGSSKTVLEAVDARLPIPAIDQWNICPFCSIKSLPVNENACKPILSVNSRHELMPTQEMNRYEN